MSENAVSGQAADVEIEVVPIVPGTFVKIGEVIGDISFNLIRNTADASAHGETVDSTAVSPLQRREPITLEMHNVFDNVQMIALHDHFANNTKFGVRLAFPDQAADTDEIILSAKLSAIGRLAPFDADTYKLSIALVPTGPFKIDGTLTP